MAEITLQVIDGADRGRTFDGLTPPVTIGREEGNSIQLNDERISRFHLKIQEDHDNFVLTDLESTNGTKVNGEDIRLRILRFGDVVSVGRSVMVFGSRDEIADRLAEMRKAQAADDRTIGEEDLAEGAEVSSLDFELNWNGDPNGSAALQLTTPPELPERLTPGQAAQTAELLEYLHLRLRALIETVHVNEDKERVTLDFRMWQNLLDLQGRLSEMQRQVTEPEEL